MTQTPDIIPAHGVPGDLITVVDERTVQAEVADWHRKMLTSPGLWDRATRGTQDRINRLIPERVHRVITSAVEAMTRGIMTGSDVLKAKPTVEGGLAARELKARAVIARYRTTASVEGGVAGAGGLLLAAVDFPALMAIKVRMLSEIVAAYGWGGGSAHERLFLLHIFHLAFASARRRPEAMGELEAWIAAEELPDNLDHYDWRGFQSEYRDYIDLAKLAQMIPLVGAPIGVVVNWRLADRLGQTAIMACRLRWLAESRGR